MTDLKLKCTMYFNELNKLVINETIKTSEAGITDIIETFNNHYAMWSRIINIQNSWNQYKTNKTEMIDNIIALILNLLLWWLFLTFVDRDNHETV